MHFILSDDLRYENLMSSEASLREIRIPEQSSFLLEFTQFGNFWGRRFDQLKSGFESAIISIPSAENSFKTFMTIFFHKNIQIHLISSMT